MTAYRTTLEHQSDLHTPYTCCTLSSLHLHASFEVKESCGLCIASDGWCAGKLAKKRSIDIVVGMIQDTSTRIHLLTLMQISIALSPSFPRPENIPSEQSTRKMTLSRPLNKVADVPPSFSSSSSTTASPQALPQFQPDVVEVEPLWYPPTVAIFSQSRGARSWNRGEIGLVPRD